MSLNALVTATVAAVVGLRLAVVLSGSHLASHYEELYRGTIAREIVEGLRAPLWSYQADHYSGGSLVVGLLAAPAIALLGPRLLVLKLVPIAFAAATAALGVRLLGRRFGMRAALAGAILLAVPPPALVQLELLAKGFHAEAPLFTVGALSTLLTFIHGRRRRWLLATALIGGLGVSFTPIAALGLAGVVAAWLVLDRGRIAARDVLVFAVGVAAGIAPALAYLLAHGLAPGPPSIAEAIFATPEPLGIRLLKIPARVVKLVGLGIPLAAGFPDVDGLPGLAISALYAVLALGAVSLVLTREIRGERSRGTTLALALPGAVFVVIYAATPIAIPSGDSAWASRHLAPVLVLGLLLAAVATARLRRGTAILVALALLGAIGQATLVGSEPVGLAWRERADSYYHLGLLWTMRAGRGVEALDVVEPRLDRLPAERRAAAYRGAIEALEPADAAASTLLPGLLARVPAGQHPIVWESFGRWLAGAAGTRAGDVAARLAALPPHGRRLACGALELARAHDVALAGRRALERWMLAPSPAPCGEDDRPLALGYLLATYRHADGGCAALRDAVARLDGDRLRFLYRGAGRGAAVVELARAGVPASAGTTGVALGDVACLRPRRPWSLDPPDGVATLAAAVPPQRRDDFFWGVGWEIADAFSEDSARVGHTIDRLPAPVRPAALGGSAAAARRFSP